MGKNWAIAIGINEYQNMRWLNYAQRDAESVCQLFRDELKFDRVDLFAKDADPIRYDDFSPLLAHPSFGNLDNFFDVRFERPFLNPGDNLWFFFAGHGIRHRGRDCLMPIDSSPRRAEKTAIPISDIAERLRRSGADNVILMIDACRGEGDRDGGEGVGREEQKGIITLFACNPDKLSYEIEELKQGAFTHALLEGLRLQGAGNCATVERLDQHLKYKVPELNRRYQKPDQVPYTRIEPISKSHLILLPSRATLQDVMAMKNDALEAEAEQAWDDAEHLWTRVLVASPADRQAIKGLQRIAIRRASSASQPPPSPSPSPRVDDQSRAPSSQSPQVHFSVVRVNSKGDVIETIEKQAEQSLVNLPNGIELPLVKIPSGEFWMGAKDGEKEALDREYPRHRVSLNPFWMGQYPITQKQWKAIARLDKVKIKLNPDCTNFKGENLPVEQVSWYEAQEFCDRLSRQTGKNYRLPTEAQWEYACRAGTQTPFHFGETITTDQANYDGNYTYGNGTEGRYRKTTTPVGSFSPNDFGLYDMHGNVWEWCLDHWHETYEGAPTDGSPWLTENEKAFRLLRGGSWNNSPWGCRSAYRGRLGPDRQNGYIGFRVVCVSARAF